MMIHARAAGGDLVMLAATTETAVEVGTDTPVFADFLVSVGRIVSHQALTEWVDCAGQLCGGEQTRVLIFAVSRTLHKTLYPLSEFCSIKLAVKSS